MSQTFTSPSQALTALKGMLPRVPSPGFSLLVNDVFAIGLPVIFGTDKGKRVGAASVTREGVIIRLPEMALTEGVVGHELAHVLLETRGWPRLVVKESGGPWPVRALATLVNVVDHACVLAMQMAYGVDGGAYDKELLQPAMERALTLMRQSPMLPALTLSQEQQAEFTIGLALGAVDQLWRRNVLPDEFDRALRLFPGAKPLYFVLADLVPAEMPATGWDARRLMGRMVRALDDYAEQTFGRRPIEAVSQFVPGLHPDDSQLPASEAALLTAVIGEQGYRVQVTNRRDGLSFLAQAGYTDALAAEHAITQLGKEPLAGFCRAQIPHATLIWQPSGSVADRVV